MKKRRTPPSPSLLSISLEEAHVQVPCTCEACGNRHTRVEIPTVFQAVLAASCKPLAEAVGLAEALWNPDAVGIKVARDLVTPLNLGLLRLYRDPSTWRNFDAPASWGLYEFFVPWLETYLAACKTHPLALVRVNQRRKGAPNN